MAKNLDISETDALTEAIEMGDKWLQDKDVRLHDLLPYKRDIIAESNNFIYDEQSINEIVSDYCWRNKLTSSESYDACRRYILEELFVTRVLSRKVCIE